ncbi:MAG: YicC/YloC family endoribonuclease [Bacteroidales bacterium]
MIKSMTGFGKIKCELPDKTLQIELRSINSKQLDFNCKIPLKYRNLELEIRTLVSKEMERGKIELLIYPDKNQGDVETAGKFNRTILATYYADLLSFSKESGIPLGSDPMAYLLRLPNVFDTEQSQEIGETEAQAVLASIHECIVLINQSRIQEGEALKKDFLIRIALIEKYLAEITHYETARIDTTRAHITKALEALIDKSKIDQNRLEQELIYYIEKLDITEEKVRLAQHCLYFRESLKEKAAGKKLAFIGQEIGREINTIGSKSNDADMQKIVVQMKDELEKIKEQLCNIL